MLLKQIKRVTSNKIYLTWVKHALGEGNIFKMHAFKWIMHAFLADDMLLKILSQIKAQGNSRKKVYQDRYRTQKVLLKKWIYEDIKARLKLALKD